MTGTWVALATWFRAFQTYHRGWPVMPYGAEVGLEGHDDEKVGLAVGLDLAQQAAGMPT